MAEALQVDSAIIGAGQAGPALATALAQRGEQVALIEARQLGGTCVNNGCTPTKTLRKSARVAHMARRAHEFGIEVGEVRVDFAAAMDRMQARVDAARSGLEAWVAGTPGLTLVRGWGGFVGGREGAFALQVGERRVHAKRVYLNTGTRPFVPPIPGLAEVPHLTNETLLQLRSLPRHLLIIGGSYIGLEMGQIFRRLGAEVTVIETAPRITAREDEDVTAAVTGLLQAEGLRIVTGQPVAKVERAGDGVALTVGSERIEGSHLLVATGRLPNTEKLQLKAVGVETDARGFVPTNGRLETNVPGIWALGDINKRGAFTHTSYHDHEIVLANHDGGQRSADDRTMCYAMFTDPPLGRVGMSEAEARASGRRVRMATFQMKNVSRAKEESETEGLVKLLVDADTDRFLGFAMLGIGADEILHVFTNFMAAGGTARTMKEALPAHPTVAEFLPTILGQLKPLA
ncbi:MULTISPECIES: mercuric reductase [Ramlibacter]|uniref:Mercuric reductase n=1 Tax=Ramlibacter aquaticus TaxID=2780094 RepID=A0ABR9SHH1_9BURK|nr:MULTISPECIES: mercuric reductase [Ramlibacter]MBE7941624.1 mercuric reductase [Ramlibacter aquaticus]